VIRYLIGLDVGSTTVKAVVVDAASDEIVWKDYQRHETRQPEKCLEFLERIAAELPGASPDDFRIFVTGSGGAAVGRHLGARFVQEVNAVSLAVEKLHPEVRSVVELGGQDAKIIVFKEDPETGGKKKIPTMNDKCAGGTGAVLDKINAKLRLPAAELCNMGYEGVKLHAVAGKCGVFAETDINGLQKQGVPPAELMASLFESIVQQNLSVLTRGHTLRPHVLLLGGPNSYVRGLQECWRHNIPAMWAERNVVLPEGKTPEELIVVPQNAEYFAALGAVEFARAELEEDPEQGKYTGTGKLRWYIEVGRVEEKRAAGSAALVSSPAELEAFRSRYRAEPWESARFSAGTTVRAFLGLDGGSTSTKAVLIDEDGEVIAKSYELSRGNPIEDAIVVIDLLRHGIEEQGCRLEILGAGTTGYAKDVLKDTVGADVALVETVAHTQAGLKYYPGADVIVDVGGQDIKLIILRNDAVKDFKLNTQCSAGNGYFLQSTAGDFGHDVTEYADVAFSAGAMPEFGYGCAVFMQSDIVDFQRQGWQAPEIMAGLAAVLPKNIWLYVAQIPNLPRLGKKFLLQGGTQRNLAAVKSQVDFIESRFKGTGIDPEIIVHRHCGEAGAIGCAIEARRLVLEQGRTTSFIGLSAVRSIRYRTTRNEDTRCYFCKNKCLRTFIDVFTGDTAKARPEVDLITHEYKSGPEKPRATRLKRAPDEAEGSEPARPEKKPFVSKVPLQEGEQRLIISTCEKGTVEDVNDMRQIKKGLDAMKKANPNLVEVSAREAFQPVSVEVVADPLPCPPRYALPLMRRRAIERAELMRRRETLRIGMPRVLNMYSLAPFFLGWFQSLGVPEEAFVWSGYTSEELYKAGARRGSIDPCFPSKLGIPHVHDLLYARHQEKEPLTHIFFPMIDTMPTFLAGVQDSCACPTVTATPEATRAAFIKEGDLFAEKGIVFKKTFVSLKEPRLAAKQLAEDWRDEIGVTEEESYRAVMEGLRALQNYETARRSEARAILDRLEAENRLGVVLLSRPYHHDPGINHEITAEFQKIGYPVFTQDSLPLDDDILERLFGEEVARGELAALTGIEDVWKNSYSENTSRKLFAAKYVARHPNLVALELSSFKCGHDAPIYTVIEEIVERSGTPYFSFKDIDENKASGSIKIRIETIAYFLARYREGIADEARKRERVERTLAELEAELRSGSVAPAGARR
jgi:activator of 2-hydroxyglutaryl-CoA dehydratase/predicted nucleotide-binding protein (sugar kinase/HSP70/actin superfamily)